MKLTRKKRTGAKGKEQKFILQKIGLPREEKNKWTEQEWGNNGVKDSGDEEYPVAAHKNWAKEKQHLNIFWWNFWILIVNKEFSAQEKNVVRTGWS